MVAQIKGFRTRAQVGLRRPNSVSYSVTPQHGGLAVHWNGPRASNSSHANCEATWRNVQKFHMETNGWVDVAYSIAFCNHGYVLAGRGYGVRTAANGTNFGNQNYLAAYWIGGEGQAPTQSAYDALDWIIVDFRKKGAGRRVRPHQDFTGSACPGPHFIRHCRSRDNQNIPTSQPQDPFEEWFMSLSSTQRSRLETLADLPDSRIDNIVRLANNLGPSSTEILADLTDTIRDEGTSGRSYRQLLHSFRNQRDAGLINAHGNDEGRYVELAEFVDAVRSMNTGARGLGWFGIALIRLMRVLGAPMDKNMLNALRDNDKIGTLTPEDFNLKSLKSE